MGLAVAAELPDQVQVNFMESFMTAISVVAGMVFSLGIAILMEELIFGKVLCPMFARQAVRAKAGQVYRRN